MMKYARVSVILIAAVGEVPRVISRFSMIYGEPDEPSPDQPSAEAVSLKLASPLMTKGSCGTAAICDTTSYSEINDIAFGIMVNISRTINDTAVHWTPFFLCITISL
jgi:hypothetical protein